MAVTIDNINSGASPLPLVRGGPNFDGVLARASLDGLNVGAGQFAQGIPQAAEIPNVHTFMFATNDGVLVFDRSNTVIFDGEISGAGEIRQAGSGRLELIGHSAFTGSTVVEAGTLAVNGDFGGSKVTVEAGAVLGGTGVVRSTTVLSGGHLAPGNSIGTLSIAGDLTLSSGAHLDFELGAPGVSSETPGVSDRVVVSGDLALDGAINLSQGAGRDVAGLGYYRLITYGGDLTSNTGAIGGTPGLGEVSYQLQAGGGRVDLFISNAPVVGGDTLQHWQGGDGVWNAGNTQWLNQGGSTPKPATWAGNHAIFKDAGGFVGGSVTIDGAQSFQGLQFVDEGYRLQGGQLVTALTGSEVRVLASAAEIATEIAGGGALVKTEAGALILTGANSYTGGTSIRAGTVQIGNGGATGSIVGDVANDGALAFNRSDAVTFGGVISGSGHIRQAGSGKTELTGASGGFTGSIAVENGVLAVNGQIGGMLDIWTAGRVQGVGTVGGLIVSGTIAPGNSIGTLNVAGGVTFAPGSVYEVEANAAGESDKIIASGAAIIQGGTVKVLAGAGAYKPQTNYLIPHADGGVAAGKFNGVTSNLAFLAPSLSYSGNDVYLQLRRNDITFADIGLTPNQVAIGGAAEGLGQDNPIFEAIVNLSTDQAHAAFDQLAGSDYASVRGSLLDDSRYVRDAMLARGETAGSEGLSAWSRAFGARGEMDGDGNAGSYDRDTQGLLTGFDGSLGRDIRAGLMLGYGSGDLKTAQAKHEVDAYHAGGYILAVGARSRSSWAAPMPGTTSTRRARSLSAR